VNAGASLSQLFVLPGGDSAEYRAQVTLNDADVDAVQVRVTLTTTYLPYGEVVDPPDD
jgi:hypothetical protein